MGGEVTARVGLMRLVTGTYPTVGLDVGPHCQCPALALGVRAGDLRRHGAVLVPAGFPTVLGAHASVDELAAAGPRADTRHADLPQGAKSSQVVLDSEPRSAHDTVVLGLPVEREVRTGVERARARGLDHHGEGHVAAVQVTQGDREAPRRGLVREWGGRTGGIP